MKIYPVSFTVNENLAKIEQKYKISDNLIDKHVTTRVLAIATILQTAGAALTDAVTGVILAGFSFVSLGTCQQLNKATRNYLEEATSIIPRLFACTIKTLHPGSKIEKSSEGFFTLNASHVLNNWHKQALECETGNRLTIFFARKCATRLISLIKIPTCIIARVADFALGLLALVGATLSFGTNYKLNELAYNHLHGLAFIGDIYQSLIELLNPSGFSD